jgi:MoaA/NifB/PqqE/SkfB family radical SAM enzyme
MTLTQAIYHKLKMFRSDQIRSLPVAILMPHSACNCRCVMCDIWKGNQHLKQLTEEDVTGLLSTFRKLGTKQVLMSGGEAILHPNFFRFCEILNKQHIKVSLLSTGLTLEKYAAVLPEHVHYIIVSIDGDETTHDYIRNIPHAFQKLRTGVLSIKERFPGFRITARTVIHRINFRKWSEIIEVAKEMRIDQVSFLPADISSHAFNREVLWTEKRQQDILPDTDELDELRTVLDNLLKNHRNDIESGFIAESAEKLLKIPQYYAAFYGMNHFPFKKCNAPWVSTVIEADGTVRPCFFHQAIGNIKEDGLETILNGEKGLRFRKELNMEENDTCKKCVCYLNI